MRYFYFNWKKDLAVNDVKVGEVTYNTESPTTYSYPLMLVSNSVNEIPINEESNKSLASGILGRLIKRGILKEVSKDFNPNKPTVDTPKSEVSYGRDSSGDKPSQPENNTKIDELINRFDKLESLTSKLAETVISLSETKKAKKPKKVNKKRK